MVVKMPGILFLLLALAHCSAEKYGIAHRVKSIASIQPTLENGVNGMSIDVCHACDGACAWYVSSMDCVNDEGQHYCNCPGVPRLVQWVGELKDQLKKNKFKNQLAVLVLNLQDHEKSALPELRAILDITNHGAAPTLVYNLRGPENASISMLDALNQNLSTEEGIAMEVDITSEKATDDIKLVNGLYEARNISQGVLIAKGPSDRIQNDALKVLTSAQKYRYPESKFGFRKVFYSATDSKPIIQKLLAPGTKHGIDGVFLGSKHSSWHPEWGQNLWIMFKTLVGENGFEVARGDVEFFKEKATGESIGPSVNKPRGSGHTAIHDVTVVLAVCVAFAMLG